MKKNFFIGLLVEIRRNQYSTITVDSVINYLQKEHLLIS